MLIGATKIVAESNNETATAVYMRCVKYLMCRMVSDLKYIRILYVPFIDPFSGSWIDAHQTEKFVKIAARTIQALSRSGKSY
jgi:hypothetical protein